MKLTPCGSVRDEDVKVPQSTSSLSSLQQSLHPRSNGRFPAEKAKAVSIEVVESKDEAILLLRSSGEESGELLLGVGEVEGDP